MTLQTCVDAVIALVDAVTGVRVAPADPPDALNTFPAAVVYASSGTHEFGVAGERKSLHNIVVELHVSRRDLPTAVSQAMSFADTIPNALMLSPTLSGTADTFGAISYTFGPLAWGPTETVGFRFTIQGVKIRSNIT